MKVTLDYILFAENVINDPNGKLTIVSTYNAVLMPVIPGRHSPLKLVAVFEVRNVKKGDKFPVTIKITSPSGKIKSNQAIQTFEVQEDDDVANFNVLLNADGLLFEEYGPYTFAIVSNDKVYAKRVLTIKKKHTSKSFNVQDLKNAES